MQEEVSKYAEALQAWRDAQEETRRLNLLREQQLYILQPKLTDKVISVIQKYIKNGQVQWLFSDLDMKIWIYHIRDFHLYYFMNNPPRWAEADENSGPGYRFGKESQGPYSFKIIQDMCTEIEAQTGIPTELVYLELPPAVEPFKSRSYASLARWFESQGKEVKFISDGRKEYMGWDCTDYWVKLGINGVLYAYWSTDAHGGAFSKMACIQDEKEWAAFHDWVARRD